MGDDGNRLAGPIRARIPERQDIVKGRKVVWTERMSAVAAVVFAAGRPPVLRQAKCELQGNASAAEENYAAMQCL